MDIWGKKRPSSRPEEKIEVLGFLQKIQAFKSTYDIWHQNEEENKFLNTALFHGLRNI